MSCPNAAARDRQKRVDWRRRRPYTLHVQHPTRTIECDCPRISIRKRAWTMHYQYGIECIVAVAASEIPTTTERLTGGHALSSDNVGSSHLFDGVFLGVSTPSRNQNSLRSSVISA